MVAGWGITESGYGSSFLRYSSFTIETNNVCGRAISFYYNKTVAFCASDVKGHSAPCYGDSGGSMVRKLFLNGKYRYVTIGLVSWGGCTLGSHYGYYTRLHPFLPWIYHKVNSTCMGPGKPRNGVVTPVKSVYQPNEIIKFTCNTKYTRIGKSELKCQRDGTWNGFWPLCLGECFHSFLSLTAPCPKPAQPKNGIQLGNNFAHGHSVWFRCNTGHKRIGSFVTTCNNGKWTNKTPKCAAPCPDPGIPIDGHRYNHSFQHGDQVMFTYKSLIGRKIITCSDGRWDQMTPTCALKITDKCTFIQPSSCGVSPTSFRARMVGGNKAGRGTWPWQVGIHKIDWKGSLYLICSGTLIGKQWVLTIAHCFYGKNGITNKPEKQTFPPATYTLKLGDDHLKVKEPGQVDIEPDVIYIHQNFNNTLFENDIALIKLQKEVNLGPFVRPVCLPKKGEHLLQPGEHGYVAGWGATLVVQVGQHPPPNKIYSTVLRHSAFMVQNNLTCHKATKFFFNPNVTFCAGDGKGGNDTCKGDSGGSFVRESRQSNGKWRWVSTGLVSWGEGCGLPGKYTYYTRVEPFVDWIKETIQKDCKEADK
ncbi:Transmembrane protease serine 6 [Exaiptasia diaphana]|nr:Transmembrane protease serine 6 [Exaiptasia diaphana]